MKINKIYKEDCLLGMEKIEDSSIDLILCDLPYGTTQNKWDSIIPLENYIIQTIKNKEVKLNQKEYFLYCFENGITFNNAKLIWKEKYNKGLWHHYNRIIKERGAIILTADGFFTSQLIASNPKMFKYKLIWDKVSTTGFLNAKRMPLRRHEDICIFYKKTPLYYPKMEIRGKVREKGGYNKKKGDGDMCYGKFENIKSQNNKYYPTSIIKVSNANQKNKIHPTQKPTELFKYLIETYTKEGELVLDTCMGSGTTAIACINSKRNFIGFEINNEYFELIQERINSIKN